MRTSRTTTARPGFSTAWNQANGPEAAPPEFGYGEEWTAGEIDAGASTFSDIPGHGSHITGVAAGTVAPPENGHPAYRYVGMAPESDIIVVRLAAMNDAKIIDGMAYIDQRASALGKDAVILLAAGRHTGPHDGTDPLDVAVDEVAGPGRDRGRGAGNDGDTRIHAQATVDQTGQSERISFTVPTYFPERRQRGRAGRLDRRRRRVHGEGHFPRGPRARGGVGKRREHQLAGRDLRGERSGPLRSGPAGLLLGHRPGSRRVGDRDHRRRHPPRGCRLLADQAHPGFRHPRDGGGGDAVPDGDDSGHGRGSGVRGRLHREANLDRRVRGAEVLPGSGSRRPGRVLEPRSATGTAWPSRTSRPRDTAWPRPSPRERPSSPGTSWRTVCTSC